MEETRVIFSSGSHTLIGKLVKPKKFKKVGILILHGGGQSNKERYKELQNFLAKNQYLSLSFDTRGVGESTGKFFEGSLSKRNEDAQSAYDHLKNHVDQIVVIGCSMGGHVATMLTKSRSIHKLILLYAAAYAYEAESLPLNESFTKILRSPKSWTTSHSFKIIKNQGEKVLMMYGENEKIIPKEIQNKYKNAIVNKNNFVVLKHGTHGLLAPQNENQEKAKEETLKNILSFIG